MLCQALLLIAAPVFVAARRFAPSAAMPLPPDDSPDGPVVDVHGNVLPPINTTYYFDQLVDHSDPSKGTFKQRYWTTWDTYVEGGPIILNTPGEVNAEPYTGYVTNKTLNGLIAQAVNASKIVLEHRFFGLSNPLPDLSAESLKLLTIEQAAQDLAYFAKTVKLPQPNGDKVNSPGTPWILIGGSYSGALTSWTMVSQPGVFWAGYASSAVVEAITDYWAYFEPIRQHMPQNCSADVERVVSHFDQVFTHGSTAQINALKAQFGMENVTHLDDVAGSLRNLLWDWQSLSPYTGPNATFFQSCDALEVDAGTGKVAGPNGWGLDHALVAWGNYWKNTYLPALCGTSDYETCLGTYNASQSYYTDTSVDNENRSWQWMVCNEVGYFQDGAPPIWPSLVSRLIQPSYDERQCGLMFPSAFPTATSAKPNVGATNQKYKGWNVNLQRLFFANGHQDPWRESTVSSDFHPRLSTPSQPIAIGNGFHCSDLITRSNVDPTVGAVQVQGIAAMVEWIGQFKSHAPLQPAVSGSQTGGPSIDPSLADPSPAAVPSLPVGSDAPSGSAGGRKAIPDAMVRVPVVLHT